MEAQGNIASQAEGITLERVSLLSVYTEGVTPESASLLSVYTESDTDLKDPSYLWLT